MCAVYPATVLLVSYSGRLVAPAAFARDSSYSSTRVWVLTFSFWKHFLKKVLFFHYLGRASSANRFNFHRKTRVEARCS